MESKEETLEARVLSSVEQLIVAHLNLQARLEQVSESRAKWVAYALELEKGLAGTKPVGLDETTDETAEDEDDDIDFR